jgi:aspartate racemase
MRQYEHTPLVQVQSWSEMSPVSPLFESILVFENYPLNPDEIKRELSLDIDAVRSYDQTNYPLTVVALPSPQLTLDLFYDRSRFDRATVERMLAHFQSLLSSLAQDAEKRASELVMLSENELHQMLVVWNDTRTAYPDEACIHDLFEQQALSTPDKVAIVFEAEQLSYRELNERANRLAHYIRSKGVGPDQLIGICIDRSIEMIVGLLAILKAGAAYVPMDPNHPAARLDYMLDDTKLRLVLTRKEMLGRLPRHRVSYICLDEESEQIAKQSAANPESRVSADNLAYVIYTSGSTGRPKGVAVPHRGVMRLVRGSDYIEFNSEEIFLQLTSLSFDVSTFEIWGSLLNGATLVVYTPGTPEVEEVGEIVQRHKVTTLWLTSPLFHQMIREQVSGLKGVRQLLGGGDVLSAASVIDALEHLPGCLIVNGYGPTESTTFASSYPMTSRNQVGASVSIGRPIANTEIYVLAGDLTAVAIGAIGEIYIGGAGLARGYLNRPDLTAERFIPSPFGELPGSRLYRSGDLARLMPDGNIEFLGRADQQVKVRGQRIELTEIESVLNDFPAIKEAAVLARDDTNGDKRLVAYFAPNEGETVQTSRLRTHLKNKLPDYMVPSAFVTLDRLPMTPTGKLDRKALPAPDNTRPDIAEKYLAPRNPVEEVVAAIWGEILGIERIGVLDSFFDLGGHSLLATRVVSSVRYIFKVELPLKTLFQASTVAELSEAVVAHEPKPGQAEKIARILKQMESMSPDDINDKLQERRRGRTGA